MKTVARTLAFILVFLAACMPLDTPTAPTPLVTPTGMATPLPTPTEIPTSPPIAILNLNDAQTREQQLAALQTEPGFNNFAISPDGNWLAYVVISMTTSSSKGSSGLSLLRGGGPALPYQINLISAAQPQNIQTIYRCDDKCIQVSTKVEMLWSPDSQAFVWADPIGLWIYKLEGQVESLYTNTHEGRNVSGATPEKWSPLGRYLLVRVGHYEGSSKSVIDTYTNKIAGVPNSFEYVNPPIEFTWLSDGKLQVSREGMNYELWGIDETKQKLTYLTQTTFIQPTSIIKQLPLIPPSESNENLVDYSTSADQQKVALVYQRSDDPIFTIHVFDEKKQILTKVYASDGTVPYNESALEPPIDPYETWIWDTGLIALSMSPDGKWLVFIPTGSMPPQAIKRIPNAHQAPAQLPLPGRAQRIYAYGVVYLVNLQNPQKLIEVGFCGADEGQRDHVDQGCVPPIIWSNDSRTFAWSDERGIWVANVNDPTPRLVGQSGRGSVLLLDVSPENSYLHFEIPYDSPQNLRQSIINLQTGEEYLLPSHLVNREGLDMWGDLIRPEIMWMNDTELAITRYPVLIDTYRLDPNNDQLLVLETSESEP